MNVETTTAEPKQNDEGIVCPGCARVQCADATFCGDCGAPISAVSVLGPLEQVYAEGHMFRRAARGPTSRIVLVGMWLLFFPSLLVLITTVPRGQWPFAIPLGFLYVLLLWRVTQNYFQRKSEPSASNNSVV